MSIPPRSRRKPGPQEIEQITRGQNEISNVFPNSENVSPFYGARVYRAGADQSIGTGAYAIFDTSEFDTSSFWDGSTKLTVPYDGYYLVWANAETGGGGSLFDLSIRRQDVLAGVEREVARTSNRDNLQALVVSNGTYANAGDYFRLWVRKDFFVVSVIETGSVAPPAFAVAFLGAAA